MSEISSFVCVENTTRKEDVMILVWCSWFELPTINKNAQAFFGPHCIYHLGEENVPVYRRDRTKLALFPMLLDRDFESVDKVLFTFQAPTPCVGWLDKPVVLLLFVFFFYTIHLRHASSKQKVIYEYGGLPRNVLLHSFIKQPDETEDKRNLFQWKITWTKIESDSKRTSMKYNSMSSTRNWKN